MASIETGLAAAAAKLSHQVRPASRLFPRVSPRAAHLRTMFQQEEQKSKKKRKSAKRKVIEHPRSNSRDSSSPEPHLESQDDSLSDHALGTETLKVPEGSKPMAPGVFLHQRQSSIYSPSSNHHSAKSTSNNNNCSSSSSSIAKGDHTATAEAKGESELVSRGVTGAARRLLMHGSTSVAAQ